MLLSGDRCQWEEKRDNRGQQFHRPIIELNKGSIAEVYPMQPDVLKVIRPYLRTRADELPYLFVSNRNVPIGRFMLWNLMHQYGEAARLLEEKRKFHCLKHSIATHLLDAGADLAFVKDWLGHATIQNITIYARLTPGAEESTYQNDGGLSYPLGQRHVEHALLVEDDRTVDQDVNATERLSPASPPPASGIRRSHHTRHQAPHRRAT
jgi:hypothetical protein